MTHKTLGLISLMLLLSLLWWTGVAVLHIPHYFLPSFTDVIQSFTDNYGSIFMACGYTLGEALLGLTLATLLALSLASLCYFIPFLAALLQPLIVLSQALPLMVLAPLIVLWLGFGWSAKLTIVVLSLFFPIFIAAMNGFNQIPKLWLELAITAKASRLRLFLHVILPGSFKSISAGLKIAIAWSMLSAIIAEWVGGSRGLGFLMQNSLSRLDSAFLFANLFILVAVSLMLYGLGALVFANINDAR
jgi:putative hydroxymethylpyrimidine transport system permease protein